QTPFGTLTYGYDATSNVTSMSSSNANGASVNYAYDELNRLQTVTDNRLTPGVTSYSYDEVGNLKQVVQPNGVQSDYTYNSQIDLLTTLNVAKGAGTLARYTYTYTPARLRLSVTELSGRTASYEYDETNQLASETITGSTTQQNGVIKYVLDAVGNRL